mgnify:CR=1 FL=1
MARSAVKGEPLLPHLTADFINKVNKIEQKTGVGVLNEINHQNIITCKYTSSPKIDRYNAIGVASWYRKNRIDLNCRLTNGINEHNWVIPLTNVTQGKSVRCVFAGMTLANVEIVHRHHRYVTYRNNKLQSANTGKAHLVYPNITGPSLINIGPKTKQMSWVYTDSNIPARSGRQCGSVLGTIVEVSPSGAFGDTDNLVRVWNGLKSEAQGGYIQTKEMSGLLFVDVAPCSDTIENQLPDYDFPEDGGANGINSFLWDSLQ